MARIIPDPAPVVLTPDRENPNPPPHRAPAHSVEPEGEDSRRERRTPGKERGNIPSAVATATFAAFVQDDHLLPIHPTADTGNPLIKAVALRVRLVA